MNEHVIEKVESLDVVLEADRSARQLARQKIAQRSRSEEAIDVP
jgi:hypothetical protein